MSQRLPGSAVSASIPASMGLQREHVRQTSLCD